MKVYAHTSVCGIGMGNICRELWLCSASQHFSFIWSCSLILQSWQILSTQLVFSTQGICIEGFSPSLFLLFLILAGCYYPVVCKLLALALFKNTGNVLVPVCLEELSRDGKQLRECSPWETCLLLSLENTPTFGCLELPIFLRPDWNNKEPVWCQATGNKSSEVRKGSVKSVKGSGKWKVGERKKNMKSLGRIRID